MQSDIRGLELSTNPAGAAAFDHLIVGYITQRADTGSRLDAVLATDPDFAMAHCMRGYFAMLSFKDAMTPTAKEAARAARERAEGATERERRHIDALDAWAEGNLDGHSTSGNPFCAITRSTSWPFDSRIFSISGLAAPEQ